MNKSIENDFANDGEYKGLFAKKVYLFVLGKLVGEKIWSIEDCKDKAYDTTMEAITEVLTKENAGIEITNRYAYLMEIVKNILRSKKFIFHKDTTKNSACDAVGFQTNSSSTDNVTRRDMQIIYRVASIVDAYAMYDFSTMYMLKPEEKAVVDLMDAGFTGKEIATKLGRSESTISRLIASIRLRNDPGKP